MTEGDAAEVVLPSPCLVVLIGISGSGKSTWAAAHFAAQQIVSSDALRAVVGAGDDDITASEDAFALLEQILDARLKRRMTTVVDTLGLDPRRRQRWIEGARQYGLSTVCVVFDAAAGECRARNQARGKAVPQRVIAGQARQLREQRAALVDEDFDIALAAASARTEPVSVRTAPAHIARAPRPVPREPEGAAGLRFGLQVPDFTWPGGAAEARVRLAAIARAAEDAGFTSIWVMDHFRQIPMFGPAWHDMLDSYTTLAYIAGVTEHITVGALVTGVTHRSLPNLGKIIATLDVLSGGRARCGLGAGWFAAENIALGLPFPSLDERYALLEDALTFLPLFWGKGAPSFTGKVLDVPEALCYPRPLQEHIPILVGGNGERRTLRLAAQYADACNIIGEAATVVRKLEVLRAHCKAVGRDPGTIEVTQLSTTLVGHDASEVAGLVEQLRPRRTGADRFATHVNAGTVADQIGRFRTLARTGVATAIVSLPGAAGPEAIERFAAVIAAFGGPGGRSDRDDPP